ncbi:uncharacterized protein LOC120254471 [Dioscorea cayenensis subsp. rotundata]|uniref:Uncharacterized protein LOC120254471 n=1 Tax=Dioscorea cayennensis subsp. rotundata TaxID=55577 RepID=A0AB40AUV7_DIOCR|nr:uncharacterized protein LOC120254471 [Dioscorea cayenensis subsp. rotundata]
MQKLKEESLYRDVNIQKDISLGHGVRLPYKRAWMEKEITLATIHGKEGSSWDAGHYFLLMELISLANNNWTWFLATLGEALYGEDDYEEVITFISDWSKVLVNAVALIFLSSPHVYCLHHLEANFMKANDKLGKLLKDQYWVMRWCEMYINIAKSFNALINEARHLLVMSMVDTICERREVSAMWDTYLYPKILNKVEEIIKSSWHLRVGRSSNDTYEVVDNYNSAINLHDRKCSCKRWEVLELLCKYAIATILQTDTNVHCYVDEYFTAESYRHAYVKPIYSIPNSDMPFDDTRQLRMRPPIAKK